MNNFGNNSNLHHLVPITHLEFPESCFSLSGHIYKHTFMQICHLTNWLYLHYFLNHNKKVTFIRFELPKILSYFFKETKIETVLNLPILATPSADTCWFPHRTPFLHIFSAWNNIRGNYSFLTYKQMIQFLYDKFPCINLWSINKIQMYITITNHTINWDYI